MAKNPQEVHHFGMKWIKSLKKKTWNVFLSLLLDDWPQNSHGAMVASWVVGMVGYPSISDITWPAKTRGNSRSNTSAERGHGGRGSVDRVGSIRHVLRNPGGDYCSHGSRLELTCRVIIRLQRTRPWDRHTGGVLQLTAPAKGKLKACFHCQSRGVSRSPVGPKVRCGVSKAVPLFCQWYRPYKGPLPLVAIPWVTWNFSQL